MCTPASPVPLLLLRSAPSSLSSVNAGCITSLSTLLGVRAILVLEAAAMVKEAA